MSWFHRNTAPPPPAPDAELICAPGVAESLAAASPAVKAELDAAKGYDPSTGDYTDREASICAGYAAGIVAQECVFADKCRLRPSNPPRLA
jgi:hypothetical protein